MPARSVYLVTLSLSEAGPGRFGCQVSVTDIYHTIPHHTLPWPLECAVLLAPLRSVLVVIYLPSVQFSPGLCHTMQARSQ